MKLLNHVVYEHILIERVTEEVERMLTAINVNKVFTQSLTLILTIEIYNKFDFSRISILQQLSMFNLKDSQRIDLNKNQHLQLLKKHCSVIAEYVWLKRFIKNQF